MSAISPTSDDFPDRISPMLVKELRQGLRAKTFVGIFLCLQAFLALMILTASAANGSGSGISGIIFTSFSVAVLLIQPLRGLNAVSGEVRGNTLDMIVLTKLSSWRIVLGKWVAIVSQSALLLATIVPYLILRYFFGGMNLLGEMVMLALIFVTSMALTAVTVGLSGSNSKVLRGLILLGGIGFLLTGFSAAVSIVFRLGGGSFLGFVTFDADTWVGIGIYVAFAAYFGWSALSLGTSLIAPAAENHSWIRRLVAIGSVFAVFGYHLWKDLEPELLFSFMLMVITPALIIALSEASRLVPVVWVPFVKWGPIGRIASMLFAPGWSSGVMFSLVLSTLAMIPILFEAMDRPAGPGWLVDDVMAYALASISALLLTGLLASFSRNSGNDRLSLFILINIGLGIVALCLTALASNAVSANAAGTLWLFIWNPYVWMVMREAPSHFDQERVAMAGFVATIILSLVILLRAIAVSRQHRVIIRQAEQMAASNRRASAQVADEPLLPS
jgi:hypothetical protein